MPDCVSLVRLLTGLGIVSFFQASTGLTVCRTVRHSGISIYMSMDIDIDMECSIDMNMQHGHGLAVWIWLCSMDLDSAHAWMTDNVIITLYLTQLFYPGFTLTAGPPSGFTTDIVVCWGEPCGAPAISLHSYTVPLVQWSTRLLPAMRHPGSIPREVLM
jgi:hypothetical protein